MQYGQQRRIQDLKRNIDADLTLLRQFEKLMRTEDDPLVFSFGNAC